jgi:hypothetical protein
LTTEQNFGSRHDDLKPAFDGSVDQTEARNAPADNLVIDWLGWVDCQAIGR